MLISADKLFSSSEFMTEFHVTYQNSSLQKLHFMSIPAFKSQSFQEYRSNQNHFELLKDILNFHPYTHSIEILTSNPNPPDFPFQTTKQYFHVVMNLAALKDEKNWPNLFSSSTFFLSLSPITTGNGLFIQRSTITFFLNETTYSRFGLTGQKVENGRYTHHMVVIHAEQARQLQRIRPCEPIEGILFTDNPDMFAPYLQKAFPEDLKIEGWKPVVDFAFNIESLNSPDCLPADWLFSFQKAVNQSLFDRNKISMTGNIQRMTIEGFVNLNSLFEWISSLGENGWVILMTWDFQDIPGSFVGQKKTLQGCGGGCDLVLFGNSLSHAHRIQTINFVDEE